MLLLNPKSQAFKTFLFWVFILISLKSVTFIHPFLLPNVYTVSEHEAFKSYSRQRQLPPIPNQILNILNLQWHKIDKKQQLSQQRSWKQNVVSDEREVTDYQIVLFNTFCCTFTSWWLIQIYREFLLKCWHKISGNVITNKPNAQNEV